MLDFLIVGAGLFGATCARELADAGKRVQVIERREHVAGNCHTIDDCGQLRSVYGGHIFHTNSREIWDFVNRFGEFRQYEHRVKADYRGTVYSLPPNRMTYQQLGTDDPERLREVFFAGYSAKQWGRPIDQVPDAVLARVPVRDTWDDRWFADAYQGLPADGYTRLVERMLRCVPVVLGADYLERTTWWNEQAERVIYTGPVDALCGHVLGRLEYRSLRFEDEWRDRDELGCATMNYPDAEVPYTRAMTWRHFWPSTIARTLVTREYPAEAGEPYYPVADERNRELYERYRVYAAASKPKVILGGRLGLYQYLDMHQAIAAARRLAGRLVNEWP